MVHLYRHRATTGERNFKERIKPPTLFEAVLAIEIIWEPQSDLEEKVNPYVSITNMVAKNVLPRQTNRVVPKSLCMKTDNEAQLSQCVKKYPKAPKLCSIKLSQCYSNAFKSHWNDTSTIFLKVILQTWGFLTLYCDTDATCK